MRVQSFFCWKPAAVFLLAAAVISCRSREVVSDKNLTVWRSAHASPKQRMRAASHLVPIGTKQIDAERVLGQPIRTTRFHGPVIYAPGYFGPTNVTHVDH